MSDQTEKTPSRHAELMIELGERMKENKEAWRDIEIKKPLNGEWEGIDVPPAFYEDLDFRWKPMSIIVNGERVELPRPVERELDYEQEYWTPVLKKSFGVSLLCWTDDNTDYALSKSGLVFLTKEDAMEWAIFFHSLPSKIMAGKELVIQTESET